MWQEWQSSGRRLRAMRSWYTSSSQEMAWVNNQPLMVYKAPSGSKPYFSIGLPYISFASLSELAKGLVDQYGPAAFAPRFP